MLVPLDEFFVCHCCCSLLSQLLSHSTNWHFHAKSTLSPRLPYAPTQLEYAAICAENVLNWMLLTFNTAPLFPLVLHGPARHFRQHRGACKTLETCSTLSRPNGRAWNAKHCGFDNLNITSFAFAQIGSRFPTADRSAQLARTLFSLNHLSSWKSMNTIMSICKSTINRIRF